MLKLRIYKINNITVYLKQMLFFISSTTYLSLKSYGEDRKSDF